MSVDAVEKTRKQARFYRSQGWNPIPSRTDAKQPLVRYAGLWEQQGPSWWWTTRSPRYLTHNVQVMTGAFWRLLVVDLDGPEAIAVWAELTSVLGCPSTWASGRNPSRSVHLWFSLSESEEVCPSRTLWVGPGSHNRIDMLADRKLVTAPPSLHVETGEPYRFLRGRSPRSILFPAEAPEWLLRMPDCEAANRPLRESRPEQAPAYIRTPGPAPTRGAQWDRTEVQQFLAGRWDEVAQWLGWKVTGYIPNRGWLACRVPWREDRKVSGSINRDDGRFAECGGKPISFYDAAVRTGQFRTWREAVNAIGKNFGVPPKLP